MSPGCWVPTPKMVGGEKKNQCPGQGDSGGKESFCLARAEAFAHFKVDGFEMQRGIRL